MIKCGECGADISDKSAACVRCGAPVIQQVVVVEALPARIGRCPNCQMLTNMHASKCEGCRMDLPAVSQESTGSPQRAPLPKYEGSYYPPQQSHQDNRPHLVKSAKSRGVYIILGLFLGLLGIHNFYAGRLGIGVAQLLVTCILGWVVVGIVVTAIWVIFELFTVKSDGAGDAFA